MKSAYHYNPERLRPMNTRTMNNQTVAKAWWRTVQQQITLFLDVMLSEQAISKQDLNDAITYMATRYTYIQNVDTPPSLQAIQADLLSALANMEQSLVYQANDNTFSAQSRYQVAQSNLDSMRMRLLAFNIMV